MEISSFYRDHSWSEIMLFKSIFHSFIFDQDMNLSRSLFERWRKRILVMTERADSSLGNWFDRWIKLSVQSLHFFLSFFFGEQLNQQKLSRCQETFFIALAVESVFHCSPSTDKIQLPKIASRKELFDKISGLWWVVQSIIIWIQLKSSHRR